MRAAFVSSLAVFLLLAPVASAPAASGGPLSGWKASWIGVEGSSRPNSWIAFRKRVRLEGKPRVARARIAVDSKYWLWINGRLALFEGQLKRGPTPRDSYCDEVDLAPWLRRGENTIALLLWYWGKDGFSHHSSGRAGLLFQAEVDGAPLLGDGSWRARVHPAFGTTGPPHPNYRLSEANVRFDARRDLVGWTTPDYDDSAWPAARELGRPPCEPWGRLWSRPTPQWKDSGLRDYVSTRRQAREGGGTVAIGRLPYNAHVTPWLRVRAPAGRAIDIRTDDYKGGGTYNLRAEYVTREGEQEFETPAWINGHEVRYSIPEGVEVLGLKYRETGYGADFAGSFDSDDEALDTLWRKARRTLYVTMRDTYMDCPDRERAQWWGDAVNELGEAFYVFEPRGYLLAKKGIGELARWRREDGSLYAPVPSGWIPAAERGKGDRRDGTWSMELPRQMLASVGWYGFWTYYLYTGDRDAIEEAYPAVRGYLALWKLGAGGLAVHRAGDWDWTDWGSDKDVPVIENAWLHLALRAAVEMARLTGNEGDIPSYREKLASIEAAFQPSFWRGDRYRSPGYEGATDDRAQAMAVVSGLAPEPIWPAIRRVLQKERHASPYMEKYVLEALYRMGAPGEAVARMKERYRAQIESPLSTLWEGWGIGKKGYGGGTYNHAWSGGPLTVLSRCAAGVAPTRPGWAEYEVLPQPGPLRSIRAVVPTVRGEIRVEIERADGRLTLEVKGPPDTPATVGIPRGGWWVKSIRSAGALLWRGGRGRQKLPGIEYAGTDRLWHRFRLTRSSIRLEARGSAGSK